ncbi:MAG: ChbG/HpnK family deacetylase [Proteobacteria bacterium]|nr:ChbG/HpnK family deacetylase [Pseudomonadota bacterium]
MRRDDPKPLVLCADDFALDAGVSDGIVRLARQGRLSATSVMTLSPRWPQDAAPLAELRGRVDVGLHLDWTSPFARAAGHGMPLAAAMRRALLKGFDRAAARAVIARQLDRFEAAWQAPPDHVDGHQHVQQFAGIRDALLGLLAERYPRQPPYLRVSRVLNGAGQAAGVKARIISALGASALARGADRRGLPRSDALLGVYDFAGDEDRYAKLMDGWLAAAPSGGLVMCHPASATDGGDGDDEIGAARQREYRYLASDRFAEALARAGRALVRGSSHYVSHYTRRR